MKWQLAWIGSVLSSLLLGGWVLYRSLDGFTLIGDTPNGRDLIAQDQQLLLALWPLLLIGALISAIPAWLFITGVFFRLQAEAEHSTPLEATSARPDAPEAHQEVKHDPHVAPQQFDAAYHARWRALEERERAVAHAEQQTAQAQQDAVRQVERTHKRLKLAELRAERTTHAFQRVQRKLKRLQHPPLVDRPSNAP